MILAANAQPPSLLEGGGSVNRQLAAWGEPGLTGDEPAYAQRILDQGSGVILAAEGVLNRRRERATSPSAAAVPRTAPDVVQTAPPAPKPATVPGVVQDVAKAAIAGGCGSSCPVLKRVEQLAPGAVTAARTELAATAPAPPTAAPSTSTAIPWWGWLAIAAVLALALYGLTHGGSGAKGV